jgi:hypothetical protein
MGQTVIIDPEIINALWPKPSGLYSFCGPIITYRPYSAVHLSLSTVQ